MSQMRRPDHPISISISISITIPSHPLSIRFTLFLPLGSPVENPKMEKVGECDGQQDLSHPRSDFDGERECREEGRLGRLSVPVSQHRRRMRVG